MKLKELKLTARRQAFLEQMGIDSVEALLQMYPLRYENIVSSNVDEWKESDNVAFEGVIVSAPVIVSTGRNQTMTRFAMEVQNHMIQVTLFNRPWRREFPPGKTLSVFGVYQGRDRVAASSTSHHPLEEISGLRPCYSMPKGMKSSDMKAIMDKALEHRHKMADRVPARYREKYRLIPHAEALLKIHQPSCEEDLHQAIRALKYEEFLSFQCVLQATMSQQTVAMRDPLCFDAQAVWDKAKEMPYELTDGQKQALEEVLADMQSQSVMYRLVQGDVGCGKTAVAMLALYACMLAGKQSALLAPTEILARQHVQSLQKLGLPAVLYASSLPAARKREVLAGLKEGSIEIVCGTHALFQDVVEFDRLGLVVADEQHRFGVRQRRALLAKGIQPDFLMMSATPIPRTYAHFLYGDISLSLISTLPPGRMPVKTRFIRENGMRQILGRIMEGIEKEHRQVYVVAPAIEDNPDADMRAAIPIYESMRSFFKDRIRVGLLHGKMKQEEKIDVMDRFAAGEIDILVSTTVIEVGIDVSNATMMVIYEAHRFGLSTLHQLRGRTARGKLQGECWLLSATKDPLAAGRLKALESMTDGFAISRYDLENRGPGDLLGVRQSGFPAFVLGDFAKDPGIMDVCCKDAREILERNEDTLMLEYVAKAAADARYMD